MGLVDERTAVVLKELEDLYVNFLLIGEYQLAALVGSVVYAL